MRMKVKGNREKLAGKIYIVDELEVNQLMEMKTESETKQVK